MSAPRNHLRPESQHRTTAAGAKGEQRRAVTASRQTGVGGIDSPAMLANAVPDRRGPPHRSGHGAPDHHRFDPAWFGPIGAAIALAALAAFDWTAGGPGLAAAFGF